MATSLARLLASVSGMTSVLLPAALAGCGGEESPAAAPERALIVFAAASLREAFTAIGSEFERTHPGVTPSFNFAGSQELRTQLEHGAAADVFASADQKQMDELVRQALATHPVVFVRNEPVLIVARDSAGQLRGLADLPNATRIVIGVPEVPVGRYTLQILDRASHTLGTDFRARVEARVVSRELNVRQVLARVALGEAQAGIVYRSDVQPPPDGVVVVAIAPEINVDAGYPIAVVNGAEHRELARAWVELVLSARGQKALWAAGFSPPVDAGAGP